LSYFRLGIACPFLEDESCSIHADRPVACREYLVTSPAEACAQPTPQTVRMIRLPLQVSHALGRIDEGGEPGSDRRWVPLIVAPAWARAHPVVPAKRPGTDWIKRLVENLTGRDVPGPPPAPPLC
jgi:hypothetical protein